MFKIVTLLFIMTLSTLSATSLLKTGQTQSYDTDGNVVTDGSVKDDGFYQAGATRSYSRSNDVVKDNVTGLEWQDNESIQKPLITAENNDAGNYDDTSGDTAATYCSELTLDGGGWRLPSIEELETLPDDGTYNPSVTAEVFQHINSTNYWSSTTRAGFTYEAWRIHFYYGYTYTNGKTSNYYVRCVRGRQ